MTSFSVTSIKKAISKFLEDSVQLTTQQKLDPLFPSGWASEASGHLSVSRRFCQLSMQSSGRHGNTVQTIFSFQEESRVLCKHRVGRQLATIRTIGKHLPDAALIRKYVKCAMERRLQFTVQTLSAYVRTRTEKSDLGLLKPINKGLWACIFYRICY
jgi:hypothetical protein